MTKSNIKVAGKHMVNYQSRYNTSWFFFLKYPVSSENVTSKFNKGCREKNHVSSGKEPLSSGKTWTPTWVGDFGWIGCWGRLHIDLLKSKKYFFIVIVSKQPPIVLYWTICMWRVSTDASYFQPSMCCMHFNAAAAAANAFPMID